MERKTTEYDIRVPHLMREIIKINKVGKTELVLEHVHNVKYFSIDNFNCPWRLLTKKEQESRRYVYDKFTESCDKRAINVQPGLEYISNENSGKTLHIEIIGIKLTPGMDYSQFYKDGYISSIVERYLDGHGEFENTNYIYDENGYYPVDEEGNTIQKKWSYRYDMYAYFYKVI